MEIPIEHKQFVCVEYPAIVNNDEQMLKTLGTETNVSKVYAEPVRRIELRWRPDDLYCKPLCADRHNATCLLLKVRRRKKPTHVINETNPHTSAAGDGSDTDNQPKTDTDTQRHQATEKGDDSKLQVQVLGFVETTYKFDSLCDFQYLCMQREKDGVYTSLRDQMVLTDLVPRSWLDEPVPLHLPPPIFSRIDNPASVCYNYKDGPNHHKHYEKNTEIIGISRKRRPHYTRFMNFTDKEVPCEPHSHAVAQLKIKVKNLDHLETVKKLFEERPIWSKNALRFHCDVPAEPLKYILPNIAYFFTVGPWRSLWVAMGFDPRKDVTTKKYQVIDYRVRQKSAIDRLKIGSKRSIFQYNLPNTVTKGARAEVALIDKKTFSMDYAKQDSSPHQKKEAAFRFRPGIIPLYRQMFYQLCDLDVDEIQRLVHANDGQEMECTEKDGWCERDIQDKCRVIISSYLKDVLSENRPEELYRKEHNIKSRGKSGPKHKAKSSVAFKVSDATPSDRWPEDEDPNQGALSEDQADPSTDSDSDAVVDPMDSDNEDDNFDSSLFIPLKIGPQPPI